MSNAMAVRREARGGSPIRGPRRKSSKPALVSTRRLAPRVARDAVEEHRMYAKKSFLSCGGLLLAALLAACNTPMTPAQSGRDPRMPDPGPDKEYQVKFPDPGRGVARY